MKEERNKWRKHKVTGEIKSEASTPFVHLSFPSIPFRTTEKMIYEGKVSCRGSLGINAIRESSALFVCSPHLSNMRDASSRNPFASIEIERFM